jgi:hypothetical protein
VVSWQHRPAADALLMLSFSGWLLTPEKGRADKLQYGL